MMKNTFNRIVNLAPIEILDQNKLIKPIKNKTIIYSLKKLNTNHRYLSMMNIAITRDNIDHFTDFLLKRDIDKSLLRSLHFLFRCEITDFKLISNFSHFLHRYGVNIENISISFDANANFSNLFCKELAYGLQALNNVYLDFRFCNQLSDDGLKPIAKAIAKLKKVQSLTLNLSDVIELTNIFKLRINVLSNLFKRLTTVHFFNIKLSNLWLARFEPGIDDIDMANLLTQLENSHFKTFTLELRGSRITNHSIHLLESYLLKRQINKIKIVFSATDVSYLCFKNFYQNLRKHLSIEEHFGYEQVVINDFDKKIILCSPNYK